MTAGNDIAMGSSGAVGALVSVNLIALGVATATCSNALYSWAMLAFPMLYAGYWGLCAVALVLATSTGAANQIASDNRSSGSTVSKRGFYEFNNTDFTATNINILGDMASLTFDYDHPYSQSLHDLGLPEYSNLTVRLMFNHTLYEEIQEPVAATLMLHGIHETGYNTIFMGDNDLNTLVSNINSNGTLQKRENTYSWVSLSYNDGDKEDAQALYDQQGLMSEIETDDKGLGNWFRNNVRSKYCVSGFDVGTSSKVSHAQAEANVAFHGEMYFGLYGGIDGFCDNKVSDMDN